MTDDIDVQATPGQPPPPTGGGSTKTRYVHKDHLGSVIAISDEAAAVVERLNYDPHGKRREAGWDAPWLPVLASETQRGFTGHEHLDNVGLIHMNGRVYDPALGRFISADPIIQFPASTQGMNRYTYAGNNPLSFTDPSGFGFFSALGSFFKSIFVDIPAKILRKVTSHPIGRVAVIIAASVACGPAGPACAAAAAAAITAVHGGSADDIVKSAVITGVTAMAFHAVGAALVPEGGGSIAFGSSAHAVKIVAHGVIGGVASELQGGSFVAGFAAGSLAAFATPAIASLELGEVGNVVGGTMMAAVAGGVGAKLGGGKFANGALTGAFGYLFNSAAHAARRRGIAITGDRASYEKARDYLKKDPGLRKMITRLEVDGNIKIVVQRTNDSYYQDGVVYWDPGLAAEIASGGTISPALILGHELGHAAIADFLGDILAQVPAGRYSNLEEWRVITFVERPAARTLGEGIRYEYNIRRFFRVTDPLAR